MRITWRSFPKLLIVVPLLHLYLAHCVQAESEDHRRRKESEQPNVENVNIAWLLKQGKLRKT
ncbi:uncharacterized protein LOC128251617 [Drosophila gunungcola]|uniref:Uncharacterized protein n=1 Tax=Drosophila gunungcola TaxID=103775 RepID=A0A9P9Z088_9MUSC|nr:uncharacterized protein LOC108135746 [Drosophila elegans]XP_052834628.1 uncharacterized protein LOC128251617 [Drosophila gunungcola]KAI8045968.1 hypothetical protein M5D96_002159 [Drosophila gunungcola]